VLLSLRRSPKTSREYLDVLRKNSLPNTGEFLEDYIDII
jgi:hypothetical protein